MPHRATLLRGAAIAAAALLLLTTSALQLAAQPKRLAHKTFTGTFAFEGKRLSATWSAWFDVTPDAMRTRLVQWDKSRELLEDLEEFKVLKRAANTATFFVERDAPFFMSNPTITVKASLKTDAKDTTTLAWERVDGSIKRFDKIWTLRAEGSGTRVTHTMRFELPMDPPDMFKPDGADMLAKDVARFRARVGAKRALAKAP